jgi:cytochrome c oxidase accessory protein FixG
VSVTIVITHSFLAYFVGSQHVLDMMTQSPKENWGTFLFVMSLSGIFLFDLGWFREQFCVIMCPYGRFQSVLYDKQTITVQYDETRGEPRKGTPRPEGKVQGDCVNCTRCVQVCPTGIDIRNGIQMECIACTGCIDACDEIMDKVGKPRGLIRYMPSMGQKVNFLRPRVLAYSGALLILISGLIWILSSKPSLHIQVLRSTDVPYFQKVENQTEYVVNSYRLHIQNQKPDSITLNVSFAEEWAQKTNWKLEIPSSILTFKPQDFKMIPFLIEIPKSELPKDGKLKFQIQVGDLIKDINFVGPNQ